MHIKGMPMTATTVNISYIASSIEDLQEAVKAVQSAGLDATVALSSTNTMSEASTKGWPLEFSTKLAKLKHHKPYNADRLQAITDGLLQLGYLPWGSKSESVGYVSFHDEAKPGSPNLGNLNTHRFTFMREGDGDVLVECAGVFHTGKHYVIDVTGDDSVQQVLNAADKLKRKPL
jgi:hypothetical protein